MSAVLSYRNAAELIETSRWVTETHALRAEVAEMLGALDDFEAARAEYLIGGNPNDLASARAAIRSLKSRVTGLQTSNLDTEQQRHVTTVRRLLVVEWKRLHAAASLSPAERDAVGNVLRTVLVRMERHAADLLEHRSQRADAAARVANVTFGVAAMLALVSVALLFHLVRAYVAARERASAARDALLVAERAARAHAEESQRHADRARAEAESANRAKDEFLAMVSHELRSPLNAIRLWASVLRKNAADAGKAARAIDAIDANAITQGQLVEDLLDVSRIVSGKLLLERGPVDLGGAAEAAIDAVRAMAEAKEVALDVSVDESVPVWGDRARLQQVVWNLVSNAVKFSRRGARVEVHLARREACAVLAVRDTGEGITPEFLPFVFDRFRQADSSGRRAHGGLGLGLAIVRHIVERHGGVVEAASAGKDRGATFTVTLPLFREGAAADAAAVRPGGVRELHGVRVLLVDEDAETRASIAAVLGESGAHVTAVGSTIEATAMLEREPLDVLLSDITLPDEDGYAFIRRLRAGSGARLAGIPAAALTTRAAADERARALSAGFQAHLAKPVGPDDLVAVVGALAGLRG